MKPPRNRQQKTGRRGRRVSPEAAAAGARSAAAWLGAGLLAAAIFAAYLPVWNAGFIWDDDDHVTANPCVVGPLGFREIWTTSAAIYYPLVLTTFRIEHTLWGLHPLPYHLVNLAMHALAAVLLWRVLRHLKVPGAWFGAALWALHPVQVESVAWITELKNTQSAVFFLLAIRFFLKWRDPAAREQHYFAALLCALLAILSKASAVMLPAALALIWWWQDWRWHWRQVPRLAPFFLLAGLASAWTIWEQRFHSGATGAEWALSWTERLIIAGRAVWFYFGKLLWPYPLVFIYPRWNIVASHAAAYLPAVAVFLVLAALWWRRTGPARAGFFAFAFFAALLFPVLGFFNVYFFRYSFVGDHFQYLASMGPLALAGAGITLAIERLAAKRSPAPGRPFLQPIAAAILIALAVLTQGHSRLFRDNETLFQSVVARNPSCWMAWNNLGVWKLEAGDPAGAKSCFEKSLQFKPDYSDAWNNLGAAYDLLKDRRQAIECYERATRLQPDYADAWFNLATDYLLTARAPAEVTKAAQTAMDIAQAKGRKLLAARIQPLLDLYPRTNP